jgi:hypothetical protein
VITIKLQFNHFANARIFSEESDESESSESDESWLEFLNPSKKSKKEKPFNFFEKLEKFSSYVVDSGSKAVSHMSDGWEKLSNFSSFLNKKKKDE